MRHCIIQDNELINKQLVDIRKFSLTVSGDFPLAMAVKPAVKDFNIN